MNPRQTTLLAINVLGGVAVLGSYAAGIASHPQPGAVLWGAVPAAIQPLYTASMLTATLGYFLFGPYVLFGLDLERATVGGRSAFATFAVLFVLVLGPSAAWMPLTFAHAAAPSEALWLAVRVVLALVGVGAVGMLLAVALARPVPSPRRRTLAIVGAALFAFQTAGLDATVWTALYRP